MPSPPVVLGYPRKPTDSNSSRMSRAASTIKSKEASTGSIEQHPVGMVEIADAAHPGVVIDATEIDQVQETCPIVGEWIVIGLGWMAFADRLATYPVGEVARCIFLKEELAGDAVGVALHGEWPVLEMGEQPGGDAVVEGEQIAFRPAVAREEDFVEIGELYRVAIDFDCCLAAVQIEEIRVCTRVRFGSSLWRSLRHFAHHVFGVFIFTQADEHRCAQHAILGPLEESHLADEFRLHPRDILDLWLFGKGSRFGDERLETGVNLLHLFFIKSGAHLSAVAQLAIFPDRQDEGAEDALAFGKTGNEEFLFVGGFHF